jgi:hypothetical protein
MSDTPAGSGDRQPQLSSIPQGYGSVHTLNYEVSNAVVELLCRKNDGEVIDPANY